MSMVNRSRVILPKWCWNNATNKQELKQNISTYLQRYPSYRPVEIGKYFVICER